MIDRLLIQLLLAEISGVLELVRLLVPGIFCFLLCLSFLVCISMGCLIYFSYLAVVYFFEVMIVGLFLLNLLFLAGLLLSHYHFKYRLITSLTFCIYICRDEERE